jgi:aspartate aminotransferase-like enzyme
MRELSETLKRVYGARSAVIVPGGGTYGMESAARQFASGKRCLILRNGWFSYRWTQILEVGAIASSATAVNARRMGDGPQAPYAPAPIDEVEARIADERPDVVFAPHVETASGIVLPDDYLKRLAAAVHGVGGLFVLDCIASGTLWLDMPSVGADVLISAPQKGWSGTPCCGLVMLGEQARERIEGSVSTSFALDLGKWLAIMETYEAGGHAYHATMPTDSLRRLRNVMNEMGEYGFDRLRDAQLELGRRARSLLVSRGFPSVAADGFEAPGVVVSYTADKDIVARFAAAGMQVAAGVPLMCDEPADYRAFRIGLFGLDKLYDIAGTVGRLEDALTRVAA